MTDSAHTVSTVPSPGNEASVPINDLLAIPEIVNQLPDWVQEPFRRYVRLKQRNWPAKTCLLYTSDAADELRSV